MNARSAARNTAEGSGPDHFRSDSEDRGVRRAPELRKRVLRDLPVTERRIEAAGIPTVVLEGGEGAPIVLLHGPMDYGGAWARVIPALTATRRVVAPDLPGHGSSGLPDGDLDEERVLAWLGELLDATCSSPATLVGHALGGAVATRFAVHHGDRLRGLVLVGSPGLAPFRPSFRFALALLHYMMRPKEGTYDRLLRQCTHDLDALKDDLGGRWSDAVSYHVALSRDSQVKGAVRSLMRRVGVPVIPEEQLARIRVPTTLIWGRQAQAVELPIAEGASDRFGWPLHVLEATADDPPQDSPRAFLKALDRALEKEEAPWS